MLKYAFQFGPLLIKRNNSINSLFTMITCCKKIEAIKLFNNDAKLKGLIFVGDIQFYKEKILLYLCI
jgi:hypothetical protein